MADTVMEAPEGSCGVRPDFIARIRRLLAAAAQQADWPPLVARHPRILGKTPYQYPIAGGFKYKQVSKVFAAQQRPLRVL
jgi:hypothetical protein